MLQNDKDCHGWWNYSHRIHETYADTTIAFMDTKIAVAMCKGIAIAYLIDELSGLTDKWILNHVVPHMVMHGLMSKGASFGGILCWSGDNVFPSHRHEQIMSVCQDLGACNIL